MSKYWSIQKPKTKKKPKGITRKQFKELVAWEQYFYQYPISEQLMPFKRRKRIQLLKAKMTEDQEKEFFEEVRG